MTGKKNSQILRTKQTHNVKYTLTAANVKCEFINFIAFIYNTASKVDWILSNMVLFKSI